MANIRKASRLNNISKSSIRKIFNAAPENSINMGLGELQFPTPEKIIHFAQNILNNGYLPYTSNAGDAELIKTIIAYYNNVSNTDVCVTVGAEEAVFISILSYVEDGDDVLIADPGFVAYESIVKIAGGKSVKFDLDPENNFRIDICGFESKITSRTKMIVISNPSNPLGLTLTEKEITYLLEISHKYDLLLLVDEIYRELYHTKKPETMLGKHKNVIVVSGISKSHCMTGWRLGWVIADKDLIEPMIDLHQYNCTCASYLSQKTAVYALSDEGMAEKEVIRKYLSENYNYMISRISQDIPQMKFIESEASPYLMLKSDIADDEASAELLSKAGIICIPGSVFGNNSTGWLRISYGINRDLLEKAVDKIISIF